MRKRPVYLDNHATTRPDPRVLEAIWPYFDEFYGNASSSAHRFGWEAADAVETAREQLAKLIGAEPREVVFTSGATEANNLAIKGVTSASKSRKRHLVTAATEHKAVLDPLRRLSREGWQLAVIKPGPDGLITPDLVAESITDDTLLVSIMAANNEVGTINPVAEIGQLCRSRGVLFHTDATQAVGKIPLDLRETNIDLLSLSAHKFFGPKGIGALYVRRDRPSMKITPLMDGGGQERGLRSGTLAVPLIVGLGVAAQIALDERETEATRVSQLRDRLHLGLEERLDGLILTGHVSLRLPGSLNLSFPGVDGEALMMAMRDIAVSSGSACTSSNPEPSHVLRALGLSDALSRASLRFGLGRFTTDEEIDFAIDYVADAVRRLRGQNDGVFVSTEQGALQLGIDDAL